MYTNKLMDIVKLELTHHEKNGDVAGNVNWLTKICACDRDEWKNSDISSDEEEFKNMIVDDRGMEESDEVLSINSPIL